jgi:hypothetical protein
MIEGMRGEAMSRAAGEVQQPGAVRLTFAYDTSGIRLVERTPVGKAAPPSEDPGTVAPEGVLTVELRTPGDAVTYRQALPRVMTQTIEIPSDVPGGLQRVPNLLTSGAFTAVVPADETATEVVLTASTEALPPGLQAALAAPAPRDRPVELGRFRLRDEPVG